MSEPTNTDDKELAAIQVILSALEPLEHEPQQRVFDYIAARLGIETTNVGVPGSLVGCEINQGRPDQEKADTPQVGFATFAELHAAADPKTGKDRVLLAAYWLQVCEGAESFVSLSVNKALKDLGYGISNVTTAFDSLRSQKPALVLQLKKAGTSRQARKTYKLTEAGVEAVKEMLGG